MGAAFVKIPRLLLEQNSGPGAHRRYLLYGHIQSHCSASGQGCWASITTLAREAGLGVRTVKRALRELLEQGWVVQELRPGHSSVLRALEAPVPNPDSSGLLLAPVLGPWWHDPRAKSCTGPVPPGTHK